METNKRKAFECKDCGSVSKCKTDFDRHLRTHTGEKPYCCSICGKSFSREFNCRKHELTHLREKLFKCDICSVKYATKQSLSKHMRFHTGENLLSCAVCSKKFTQSSHLSRHLRTHTGEKPYKCSSCDKSFALEYNLKMHVTVHEENEICCSICETKFSHQGSYWRHMRKHGNKKGFENHNCDKEFSPDCNLDSHTESPTEEGPFKCKICGKKFRVKSDFHNHNLIHGEVEESLQCFECGKRFVYEIELRDHMQKHSGVFNYCVECNKKFATSYSLEHHRKMHVVEAVNCFHCQKIFSSLNDLKKHRYSRACVSNKFRCSLCDRVFVRKVNVVQHMKSIHACDGESNETTTSNVANAVHCSVCEELFPSERCCIWHEVCVHKLVEQLESSDSLQHLGLIDTNFLIANRACESEVNIDRVCESEVNIEGDMNDFVEFQLSKSDDNKKNLSPENGKNSWNFIPENSIFIKEENVDKDVLDLSPGKKMVDCSEMDTYSEVKVNTENHIMIKDEIFLGSVEQEPSNTVRQVESVSPDFSDDSEYVNEVIGKGETNNYVKILGSKHDGKGTENLCLENTIFIKEEIMDVDIPEVTLISKMTESSKDDFIGEGRNSYE